MKLATRRNGGRDGALVVVSRDLSHMADASSVAPTLQRALDDWQSVSPRLEALYAELQSGSASGAEPFDPALMDAPLPRAYAWMDGSVYLSHMRRARELRKVPMIPDALDEPLMYEGISSRFLAAQDPLVRLPGDVGLDLEGEIAVILDDVPMRVARERAGSHIRLLTLVNDTSLRTVFAQDTARDRFGTLRGKPPCAMAPVVVTPDELGDDWDGRKISLPLRCHVNGQLLGMPDAGADMQFDYPALIAHAAWSRPLGAGTVLASGTVSNNDASRGGCCIAERRMIETKESGAPKTPYLEVGDRIRIEMLNRVGQTIFGAIDQKVMPF